MSNEKNYSIRLSQILSYLSEIIKDKPDKIDEVELYLKNIVHKKNTKEKEIVSFNIFSYLSEKGEEGLRKKLEKFTMKELRKLITFHGFNNSKTIQKWKKDQLINNISEGAISRSQKGRVFMQNDLENSLESIQTKDDKKVSDSDNTSTENTA